MHPFTCFLEVLNFVVVILRQKSEIYNLKNGSGYDPLYYGDPLTDKETTASNIVKYGTLTQTDCRLH